MNHHSNRSLTLLRSEIRFVSTAAGFLAILGFALPQALADVVWIRGQPDPIFGWIQSVDEAELTIAEDSDGSNPSLRTLARSEVETYLVTIDTHRLSQLALKDPSRYLELAEELSSVELDPAARATSRRLYFLAANDSSGAVRTSALIGLMGVARDKQERGKIAGLYFLETGRVWDSAANLDKPGPMLDARARLLTAIRQLRRGERQSALKEFEAMELDATLRAEQSRLSGVELTRWAGLSQLSARQLTQLLVLEQSLSISPGNPASGGEVEWGEEARMSLSASIEIPSLESISEFALGESVFRDGRWQRPAK